MEKKKTVIIIGGPTASGKTDLSLQLASYFNTSIISADSRQCFRELNIGVAKPAEVALQSIKHYFINSHSIHAVVNAQVFEQYALHAAEEIFSKNDIAIMVGGTGFYIKAFCEGLDEMPEADKAVRQKIINDYKEKGLAWLQNEVQKNDSAFWKIAEQKNPQRLMRALEIFYSTGNSVLQFKQNIKKERAFNIIKLAIDLPKTELHNNIELRVDKMIEEGLLKEVKNLYTEKENNALRTVGYQEIFDFIDNKITFDRAVEEIKTHTKQYAKRQLTWIKKNNFQIINVKEFDFQNLNLLIDENYITH